MRKLFNEHGKEKQLLSRLVENGLLMNSVNDLVTKKIYLFYYNNLRLNFKLSKYIAGTERHHQGS